MPNWRKLIRSVGICIATNLRKGQKQWLSPLVELERQLARPDLQQARSIPMIGAGIVERCDTIEEFPHLGFACRLADNRKDRLLQGSRHTRHTGWSFSGKRLTIEFSFAGDDHIGPLDFGAQLDRFRDHLKARSDGGAAKCEKPKAKAARCTGPRDIAVVVVKCLRRNFCQVRKRAFEGLELL